MQLDPAVLDYINLLVQDDDEPPWDDIVGMLLEHGMEQERVSETIDELKDEHLYVMALRSVAKCASTGPQTKRLASASVPTLAPTKRGGHLDTTIKKQIMSKYDLQKIQDKPIKNLSMVHIDYLAASGRKQGNVDMKKRK